MISIFSVYILPALILAGIGSFFGVLIAIFNKYFYVEDDNRVEELVNLLPGYNCGSCGFAGCKGLAEDIIINNGDLSKCKPLSSDQKKKAQEYIDQLKNSA
ncbi:MAG: (Fe-S)-binding protein [Bacilli bacterium]|jgi:electron transport complex protein RnfB